MKVNQTLLSRTIAFLRFPLAAAVVLQHSVLDRVNVGGQMLMSMEDYPVYYHVGYCLSKVCMRISVPTFFIISGILFFYRMDGFTSSDYGNKLRKRLRTPLVPYVLWNLIVILLLSLAWVVFPGLMSGNNKPLMDYTAGDWLAAFWNVTEGFFPVDGPMWYVRELMVMAVCSPVIYVLVKRLRHWALLLLGAVWLSGWMVMEVPGFNMEAFFFFSVGAYFSVNKKDPTELLRPCFPAALVLWLLLAASVGFVLQQPAEGYLTRLSVLAGVVAVSSMAVRFVEKGRWRANEFLSDSSFFVFAYHSMFLLFVMKFALKIAVPQTEAGMFLLYFACPVVTIAVGLGLYYLLRRFAPRLTALLTGGR